MLRAFVNISTQENALEIKFDNIRTFGSTLWEKVITRNGKVDS
ncbi:hypothetical protein PL11201_730024 [Planktothrix sp. PCC 11201]|jgi:hypothetical protein|nr:hypothetical protein PL11201_730024 [Planktothrix sp. PCC 11201]